MSCGPPMAKLLKKNPTALLRANHTFNLTTPFLISYCHHLLGPLQWLCRLLFPILPSSPFSVIENGSYPEKQVPVLASCLTLLLAWTLNLTYPSLHFFPRGKWTRKHCYNVLKSNFFITKENRENNSNNYRST